MNTINDYVKYKNDELYFNGVRLIDLVKEYGDSLEVSFPSLISDNVKNMKNLFYKIIKEKGYTGSYIYSYATKANYHSESVLEALKNIDSLETSSRNDIKIVKYLRNKNIIGKDYECICNGFIDNEYLKEIEKLSSKMVIYPVIDSIEELKGIISLNKPFKVGIRINVDKILNNGKISRFGVQKSDFEEIHTLIKNSKLEVDFLHFHMNGTITNIDTYIKEVKDIFETMYLPLKKLFPSMNKINIGGGMPSIFAFDKFEELISRLIETLKELSIKNNVQMPSIIGEHGKYTVSSHSLNIFKVNYAKKEDGKYWYVLNNSITSILPDVWICNTSFDVLPLKKDNTNLVKVLLAGNTCDPDDIYQKGKEVSLPLKKDEEFYIAFIGTGAYQRNISGINTNHHCLLEEPRRLLIENNKVKVINKNYNIANTLQLLGYK